MKLKKDSVFVFAITIIVLIAATVWYVTVTDNMKEEQNDNSQQGITRTPEQGNEVTTNPTQVTEQAKVSPTQGGEPTVSNWPTDKPSTTPAAVLTGMALPTEVPVISQTPAPTQITSIPSGNDISPSPKPGSEDTILVFEDKTFESAFRNAIGKAEGDIYKSEVETLTILNLSGMDIVTITDIKLFPNLEELDISWNNISDASPLVNTFKLTKLDISFNFINDVSILKDMSNMKELYIGHNYISDLESVRSMNQLTDLGIEYNNINDISALGDLPQLRYLVLEGNPIVDFSPASSIEHVYY